jgi:hypothetical protein
VERVLVGLAAVALLFCGRGHGRADYVFVCQLDGPTSGDGQFPNSGGLTVDASGNIFVLDARHQPVQLFTGSRPFLTDFGDLGSDDKQFVEPTSAAQTKSGNTIVSDPLNALSRPLSRSSAGRFIAGFNSFGFGGAPFGSPSSEGRTELIPSYDVLVADTIDPRSDMSTGDDPYVGKFGSFGIGQASSAAPPSIAVNLSGISDKSWNHKLVLGLLLPALGVLGALGYAWLRRKRLRHRTLRGPRRTARFRSPSIPNPRGPTG